MCKIGALTSTIQDYSSPDLNLWLLRIVHHGLGSLEEHRCRNQYEKRHYCWQFGLLSIAVVVLVWELVFHVSLAVKDSGWLGKY